MWKSMIIGYSKAKYSHRGVFLFSSNDSRKRIEMEPRLCAQGVRTFFGESVHCWVRTFEDGFFDKDLLGRIELNFALEVFDQSFERG
ncbi:hypothetical protein CFP56_009661 [Quercus suber]|uniref:Uncharacterized protein n=1 Tax=Quercus suber TaxID=58331 RepID=A0AAW0M4S3_QUESU